MDLDQTQAIAIDYEYDDDETDDETTSEAGKRPVAHIKLPCQKGVPEKIYPLFEGDNIIGRQESCDVCIPVKALSKQHACIEINGESFLIYDKESRNKTRRGKLFLSPNVRYELKHDDSLVLADVHCIFQIEKQMKLPKGQVSGSETGSESLLAAETTTSSSGHQETLLSKTVYVEDDDDDDENSNDSIDLLQPTQAFPSDISATRKSTAQLNFFANSQEDKDEKNTTTVAVEDTPFPRKKTKDLSTLASESEADDSFIVQTPQAALVFQDEKNTSSDAELLGAPTQAFLAESDLEENSEDEDNTKTKTLLSAATQVCPDTASDSEQDGDKETLYASTQAFTDRTKTEHTLSKPLTIDKTASASDSGGKTEKTSEISHAPEGSDKVKDKEPEDHNDGSTQELDEHEGESDEQKDLSHLFSAPTLACDLPSAENDEENGVTADEDTQAFGDNASLVLAVSVDEKDHLDDSTKVVVEDATVGVGKTTNKPDVSASNENDTLVFNDTTQAVEGPKASQKTKDLSPSKNKSKPGVSTSDENVAGATDVTIEVIEEPKASQKRKELNVSSKEKKGNYLNVSSDDEATQMYKLDVPTLAMEEPERGMVGQRLKGTVQVSDLATFNSTQVFEVRDDATVIVEEQQEKVNQKLPVASIQSDDDATMEVADNTLAVQEPKKNIQAFDMADDTTVVLEETTNGAKCQKSVPSDEDDATQKIEMGDNATVPIEEPEMKTKGLISKENIHICTEDEHLNDDNGEATVYQTAECATPICQTAEDDAQVFQTANDATLAIAELENKPTGCRSDVNTPALVSRLKGKKSKAKIEETFPSDEDAAETVKMATTVPSEMEDKNKIVKETIDGDTDQTKPCVAEEQNTIQTFAVDDSTIRVEEPKVIKKTRGRPKKKVIAHEEQVPSEKDVKVTKEKENQRSIDQQTSAITDSKTKRVSTRKGLRDSKVTMSNSNKVSESDSDARVESVAKSRRGRAIKKNTATRVEINTASESSADALVDSEESTLPLDSEAATASEVSSTPVLHEENEEATQMYGGESEASESTTVSQSRRSSRRQTTGAMIVSSRTRAGNRRSVQPGPSVTKKKGKQNKAVALVPLETEETQAYCMDMEDTPEIDVQVESPKRTPLKTSLVSPDKKRSPSPSPKRVAFKKQKSLQKEKQETISSPRGRSRKTSEESESTKEKKNDVVKENKRMSRKHPTSQTDPTPAEDKEKNQNLSLAVLRLQQLDDSEDDLNKSGFSKRTRRPGKAKAVDDSDSLLKDSKQKTARSGSSSSDERGRRGRSARTESSEKSEMTRNAKKDAVDDSMLEDSKHIKGVSELKNSDERGRRGRSVRVESVDSKVKINDNKPKAGDDEDEIFKDITASDAEEEKGKTRYGSRRDTSNPKNKAKTDDVIRSEQSMERRVTKRQQSAADKGKLETNEVKGLDGTNYVEDKPSNKTPRTRKRGRVVEPKTAEQSLSEGKSRRRKASPEVNDVKLKQTKIDNFASIASGDVASPVSKVKDKKQPVTDKSGDVKTRTTRCSLVPNPVTTDSRSEKTRRVSGPAATTGSTDPPRNTRVKRRGHTDSQSSEALTPTKKTKSQAVTPTPTNKTSPKSATPNMRSPSLRKTLLASKPKVMFTGVVDEQGEKIVKDLGGELDTSLLECTHLVTDKVRRTVKFLGCLARGLPIVNPLWLTSCKVAGTFIDCSKFVVFDSAAEKQYKFSLHRSLELASSRRLFTDYRLHVTKSVRPDPAQMKDILQCAGAKYVPAMPKKLEENLIVISCDEDRTACKSALNAGIPVVSAEFVLTGILKQELNVKNYQLFADTKVRPRGTSLKGRKR